MWGALIFLLLFLVIDPTTRDIILAGVEQARLQLAVEAPLSYFLAIILAGSAAVSAFIMAFWPRTEDERRVHHIVRRYQGAAQDEVRLPVHPSRYLWTFASPAAWFKRMRVVAGFACLKRMLGA
jgi:hypothetical protein